MSKALVAHVGRTLSEEFKGKPLCVLADVSGSMTLMNTESGKTSFDEMKDALCKVLAGREDFSLVAFSDHLEVTDSPEKLRFLGGTTELATALNQVRKQKPEQLLIVTDGMPTDSPRDACLEILEAKFPWVKVDVLFVGTPSDSIMELMNQIARNGGKVLTARTRMLENITLLLGDGGTL